MNDDGIHPSARGTAKRSLWLLVLVIGLCLAIDAAGVAMHLWTPA